MRAWAVTLEDPYEQVISIVRAATRGKALVLGASDLGLSVADLIDAGYSQRRVPELDGGRPGRLPDWEMLPYVGWFECGGCYTKIKPDRLDDGSVQYWRSATDDEEDGDDKPLTPVHDHWFVYCSLGCWRSFHDRWAFDNAAQFGQCPDC